MCKLLITAREFKYWRTPQMTILEMATVAGVSERTMWGHLSEMRQSVHVSVESPRRGHYVLHFLTLAAGDTSFGADLCSSSVVVDPILVEFQDDNQQQHSSVEEGGMGGELESANLCTEKGNSAKPCTERPSFVTRKLAEMGIFEPTRSELAAYPWANESYAAGWAAWRAAHPKAGDGLLVLNWRAAVDPPEVTADEVAGAHPLTGTCPGCYRVLYADCLCMHCNRCVDCCECREVLV